MCGLSPMIRRIEPEWLDALPPEDRDAMISRRDLRRINALMRNAETMAGVLHDAAVHGQARRLVEIGAGDGEFLLTVARRLARRPGAGAAAREAVLVDRQFLLRDNTVDRFAQLRWAVRAVQSDVMDYLADGVDPVDAMVANLFLHHFPAEQLRQILHAASQHASLFIAIEPKRSRLAWLCTHCLCLIGCNTVTRHDAPISVRAGFGASELSQLWPASPNWRLAERSSGPFSHLFVARRIG
jgi:hypothetical protein